jgi:hypothetical protein
MDRPGWVRYTQKRFGLIGRQTFYLVLSLRTLLLVLHEGPDISDPLIGACSHSRLSIFQSLAHPIRYACLRIRIARRSTEP